MNRITTLFFACVLLPLLLPALAVIAVAIAAVMGTPVLFRQDRPGKDGKIFQLIKFRTMKDGTDADGNPLPDEERLTRFGTFLRRTSLDELPELWNVLRGDMNLVGPRPLLVEYLPLYTEHQNRRHEVRPGITGWAQINGRNDLSWDEKFELDIWYVDNRSTWLDLKIMALTLLTVFRARGINQSGHATAEKFTGSR